MENHLQKVEKALDDEINNLVTLLFATEIYLFTRNEKLEMYRKM